MLDITGKFIYNSPILWIDFGLSILLFAFVCFVCWKSFVKRFYKILVIVLAVVTIGFWVVGLKLAWAICLVVDAGVCLSMFLNQQISIKSVFKFSTTKKKTSSEKIFDKNHVIECIANAVDSLSKTKTGALISFERSDKLNDVVKSGTILNAPISAELLCTIFYPGTRLHDGAVVIRGDEILAASVYYTPTKKALTGKYGSRHRAALGISEKTDSVTVVVSEETGRVSIAVKGELVPVNHDNFTRVLEDYLLD